MSKRIGLACVMPLLAFVTSGCAPTPASPPITARRMWSPPPIPPMADGVDLPVIGDAQAPSSPAAAWDGQGFFLAWDDYRTTDSRVAATRVDGTGVVLDGVNLMPNQVTGTAQYNAAVAAGAGTYLMAWETSQSSSMYIQAARFDSGGKLLDPTALRLNTTSTSYDGGAISIAFDGTSFVVAWLQNSSATAGSLQAVRVSPAGAVLDSKPKTLVTLASLTGCSGPKLAFDGAHVVLAWDQAGQVSFIRVAADLTALDATPVVVGGAPAGARSRPSLAGNGSGFLVTWLEADTTVGGPAIKAQAWSADAAAIGEVIAVEAASSDSASTPSVGFDGTVYTLAWSRGSVYPDAYLARLVPERGLLMPVRLMAGGDGQQYGPTVAAGNGRTLIAWFDDGRIVEWVLDSDGAPVGPRPTASLAVNRETKPAVASNQNGFMVAWLDTRDAPKQAYAAFLDANAAPRASAAVALSSDWRGATSLALGSDGTGYLAAWTLSYMSHNPAMGRLFDAAGTPTSDELTLDTTGFDPTSAAFGGGVYFVVGNLRGSTSTDTVGVRVDSTGHVLDASAITLATGVRDARVASNGSDFLVIWNASLAQGIRVGADGTILDATPKTVMPASAKPTGTPVIAFGGGSYLVAWADSGASTIMAARLSTDGTLVDQTPIQVTSSTSLNVEIDPAVTFNGTSFVVAWENLLYDSGSNVKANEYRYATISLDGVAASTTNQLGVLDSTSPSLDPVAVAGGGNGKLLAAYAFRDQPLGYSVERIKLRYLSPATVPAGGRCSSNSQCATGLCVDNLCCQTSCGGGLLDCQACSMSAGAAANGTCSAIPDGVACGSGGTCGAGACLGQPDAGSDAKRDSAAGDGADAGSDVADGAVSDGPQPPADASAAEAKADARGAGVDAGPADARQPSDAAPDVSGDTANPVGPDGRTSDTAVNPQADANPGTDVRSPANDAVSDGPVDAKPAARASSGCGCRMTGAGSSGWLSVFILGIALGFAGRRRARRDRLSA